MVTMNHISDGATSQQNVAASDRRLIHEEEVVPSIVSGRTRLAWGAVIAGSITAISLLVLSSSLAYACDIRGFAAQGYGWGSGVWAVLTAVIAFFCGGVLVSYLSPACEQRAGLVHGFLAWALAIPLLLLMSMLTAGRTFIFGDVLHMTLQPPINQPSFTAYHGAAWGTFIAMACGLLFAAIGGLVAYHTKSKNMNAH